MKAGSGVFILLLAIGAPPAWAQTCNTAIAESAPANRFQLHDDGTLTDTYTHLRWQRCSVGQQWTGEICAGDALPFSLNKAHQPRGDSWRLPSLPELSSIEELRCSQPAINLHLFPNTPESNFWSATPFANSTEGLMQFWQVQFIYGETNLGGTQDKAFLRLVRDAGTGSAN